MINPNFDPTWLLDMAKESEKHFKETLALMLEAHREEQAELERKRIIKLLEAEIERVSNPMLVDREYLDGLETAIALIKGENK